MQSGKVFGASRHHGLLWLDVLIPHDEAGVAVEVAVMLPVLDDGFRVKVDSFRGEKRSYCWRIILGKGKMAGKGIVFSHESRPVLLLRAVPSMAVSPLSVLPHVLSPLGFWHSDEGPGLFLAIP